MRTSGLRSPCFRCASTYRRPNRCVALSERRWLIDGVGPDREHLRLVTCRIGGTALSRYRSRLRESQLAVGVDGRRLNLRGRHEHGRSVLRLLVWLLSGWQPCSCPRAPSATVRSCWIACSALSPVDTPEPLGHDEGWRATQPATWLLWCHWSVAAGWLVRRRSAVDGSCSAPAPSPR